MKRQLLLYLFILSLLINFFTYMYFSKQNAFEHKRNEKLSKKLEDTLNAINNEIADAKYFTLEKNNNAQNYLYPSDVTELIPKIKDALMEYNTAAEGNKYIDQPPFGGKKFIINKAQVLNHRWIIADYSNGDYWGEVLLKYFINEDKTITFETIQSILYPKEE
jgi:hypothetical protein